MMAKEAAKRLEQNGRPPPAVIPEAAVRNLQAKRLRITAIQEALNAAQREWLDDIALLRAALGAPDNAEVVQLKNGAHAFAVPGELTDVPKAAETPGSAAPSAESEARAP